MTDQSKICSKCNIDKPLSEFNFRKDNNKYRNECKECLYAQHQKLKLENYDQYLINQRLSYHKNKHTKLKHKKEYYIKNKDSINEKTFKRRLYRKLYAILKLGSICTECKCDLLNEPWNADFHHLDPLIKENGIANICSSTMDELNKELEKCILLCGNCHRKLHFQYDLYIKTKDEILKLLS